MKTAACVLFAALCLSQSARAASGTKDPKLVCAGAAGASHACALPCSNACVNDGAGSSGCFNTGYGNQGNGNDGFNNVGDFNIGSGNIGDCNLGSGGIGGDVGTGCPLATWDMIYRTCLTHPQYSKCQNPPASYGTGAINRIKWALGNCTGSHH